MVSVNNLKVEFGGFVLFDEITFVINPKDRVGLTGKNGAGKSTLMKILAGLRDANAGNIVIPPSVSVGYLPQHMIVKDDNSVIDEARNAFAVLNQLNAEYESLNNQLLERTDYESKEYMTIIENLTHIGDRLHILGSDNIDALLEQTLLGLGFTTKDFSRPTKEFSGGWRMRIELAKILLQKPDLLLLDEPTNHLDIESIQWLEDFLQSYPGAIILISHDRAFLDNLTKRTLEISLSKIYDYPTNYSKYVELRRERRASQMATFANQQRMIEKTEDFIERFRYKASKSVQVQQRIRQLEKVDRVEVDDEDISAINIKFPPAPRSGTIVVETKHLSKSYGDLNILNDIDLVIERGEKVAFVGKNGEGKSTLSRIITGEIAYDGVFKIGHNVNLGYFAQNQDEIIDEKKTVFQVIDDVACGDVRTKVRDILGAFLFSGEDIDKRVKVLSGGERSRLALAKLLLEPYNLLVLDEPTNHLDMRSKDILKQALQAYDGTMIIVSHDREFLGGLTSKVFEFKDKKIKETIGDIYEFLAKKKMTSLKELEVKNTPTRPVKEDLPKEQSTSKLSFEEKKQLESEIRKISTQINKAETEIDRLEKLIETTGLKLSDPQYLASLPSKEDAFLEIDKIKKRLATEMSNWEDLLIQKEVLEKKK